MSQSLEDKLNELIKEFVKPGTTQEEVMDFTKSIQKKVLLSALDAEMDSHLGYSKHDVKGRNTGNNRNGRSKKRVRTRDAEFDVDIPRDRNSEFEPQIAVLKKRHIWTLHHCQDTTRLSVGQNYK